MDRYQSPVTADGKWNVATGRTIDLPADEAAMLLSASPVGLIGGKPILANKPKPKKAKADGSDSHNAA